MILISFNEVFGEFEGCGYTKVILGLRVEMLNEMSEKIVKMSDKGQLVVPSEIREKEGLSGSDRFIALPVKDGVVFKKIEFDVEEEYEKLSKEIKDRFSEKSLERKEADEAVKWARKQ